YLIAPAADRAPSPYGRLGGRPAHARCPESHRNPRAHVSAAAVRAARAPVVTVVRRADDPAVAAPRAGRRRRRPGIARPAGRRRVVAAPCRLWDPCIPEPDPRTRGEAPGSGGV